MTKNGCVFHDVLLLVAKLTDLLSEVAVKCGTAFWKTKSTIIRPINGPFLFVLCVNAEASLFQSNEADESYAAGARREDQVIATLLKARYAIQRVQSPELSLWLVGFDVSDYFDIDDSRFSAP